MFCDLTPPSCITMDSYRSQYSRSPSSFSQGQNVYSPNPSTYNAPPSIYPKVDLNFNPGFAVPAPSVSPRSSPEMPRAQTAESYLPSQATRPKTFSQWVSAAKQNTLELKKNGSPYPLVWVIFDFSVVF